jgi:hypothetical protein
MTKDRIEALKAAVAWLTEVTESDLGDIISSGVEVDGDSIELEAETNWSSGGLTITANTSDVEVDCSEAEGSMEDLLSEAEDTLNLLRGLLSEAVEANGESSHLPVYLTINGVTYDQRR